MSDQERLKLFRRGQSNEEHFAVLERGVKYWNDWRKAHPTTRPDLTGAILGQEDLSGANLSAVSLYRADLQGVDLSGANLREAQLSRALLYEAKLIGATLTRAMLKYTELFRADLTGANLCRADLRGATLVESVVDGASFTGSYVFGAAVWAIVGTPKDQSDLIITRWNEPKITVDNLAVAQFTYMLLNNREIRTVIDTIGEKGVLILGRFIPERKAVLDAIRDRLRARGFVPMMFDFERPTQRDFTETIKTLAGLSRFIIADITNPKSSPLELQAIMPDYMIPFVPIIQENEKPFAMFRDLKQKYGEWVLDVLEYDSTDNLVKVLDKAVIRPALEKGQELVLKKAEGIRSRHVHDYM